MDEIRESDTLSFEFDERNTSTLQTKDKKYSIKVVLYYHFVKLLRVL